MRNRRNSVTQGERRYSNSVQGIGNQAVRPLGNQRCERGIDLAVADGRQHMNAHAPGIRGLTHVQWAFRFAQQSHQLGLRNQLDKQFEQLRNKLTVQHTNAG